MHRRLTTLDVQAWQMMAERETEVVIQLLLAAAVKHSQLLGDFMLRVCTDRQRRMEPALAPIDWQDFLAECAHHDESVAGWSDSTKTEAAQVLLRDAFASKSDDINNQPSFVGNAVSLRGYKDAAEFVATCPLAPHPFTRLQKILESIRKVGATGKHWSQGGCRQ